MAITTDIKLSPQERQTLRALHESFPLNAIPGAARPYAELIRIHRPTGILMFYFPCLYGTFLVGALGHPVPVSDMAEANAKLFLLSFLLRGTLCSWNDILDQDFDRQVTRTRIRPLARGAVSTTAALLWTWAQTTLVFGAFALLLPRLCLIYAAPFLALHVLYPFAKRWTHHPQLMLGFAHSLGVFVAFPALGQRISVGGYGDSVSNAAGAVFLCAGVIFWTLVNDTIYAAQDVADDAKAGVGSTILYWGDSTRTFLRVLGALTVLSLLAITFVIRGLSPAGGTLYTALTCGASALALFSMVEWVDLNEPASCGWWFNKGNLLVGCGIGSGLVGEYLANLLL
ncbi:putative 4-hydroxybenzoate polyprenyl transferase [Nemania sp. FL0916]|nr:putative 4-hydroxybenzoate polyprenyl transferase [Nemania sp. FL0916]